MSKHASKSTRSQEFAEKVRQSGTVVSKTGAVYRDPETMIYSDQGQRLVKAVADIRRRKSPT